MPDASIPQAVASSRRSDETVAIEPPISKGLSPGDTLSHYRILRKIGEGGMGSVYQAVDETLGRMVAIKTISSGRTSEAAQQRFIREARAASALNHPNIITIHEFGSHNGLNFIVMEFLEGVTLSQLLAERTLPLDVVLNYARQMASALGRAHAAGVVHRDLKPGNVMLTNSGVLKLLDFGLAKQNTPVASGGSDPATESLSITQPGLVMGTPSYMSPEQAMGAEVSFRSDIFSFGVILYEMACGQRPFQGADQPSILLQVVRKDPPPIEKINPSLPPGLVVLIRDCLKKDQEERPPSLAEVEQQLDILAQPASRVVFEQTSIAAEPLPTAPAMQTRMKLPTWAWIGVGTIVMAGAFAAPRAREWFTALPTPSLELNSQNWTERGQQYLYRFDQKGNTDRSIEAFTKAIEVDTENPRAYAGLAEAYVRKATESPDPQWISRARGAAEKAVALNNLLAAGHISLGAALLRAGKAADAQKTLERAIELEPRSAHARRVLASTWVRLNETGKAEKLYREAIALEPRDWRGPNELAILLNRLGRNAEALQVLEQLNRELPSNSVILLNLSVAYHALGREDEAATAIQRSMEITPTPKGYSNLGTLLFYMGRYDNAVDAFEKALKMDANAYLTWGNLGDAYRWAPGKRKQADDAYLRATQLLERAILRNPNDAPVLALAATYYAKRGNIPAARDMLVRIDLAKEDTPASILFKAAVVEELAGARARALDLLKQALQRGYPPPEIAADPELLDLRKDPRYHHLLAQVTNNATP